MKSIKIILGGIGFLIFTICCILLANMADWLFLTIPGIISLLLGLLWLLEDCSLMIIS
ncbi:hypothetical protein [Clostridium sp.]|jgi:hypothetical protein|uniref:hypothetical protein n=1 Tax=Clostridium sp. TaxID=1506 RepID=UPI003EEB5F4B